MQNSLLPDGWRERAVINNLKKAFEEKGINNDTYYDIFLADNSLKKESILRGCAALNYKDNIDKFKDLKNSINEKVSTSQDKMKEYQGSIETIKKIDTLINMGMAQESDIEELNTIKKDAIDLLVEKGVNKKELYNELGLKQEKGDKFQVFNSNEELEIENNDKDIEISKEVSIDDIDKELNKEIDDLNK